MAGQLARSRPDRVRALVYGGHVLFDAVAVLESLGMGPDLEVRAAAEERAANGDWSAFWETFPVSIPDETKAMLQVCNDPAVQTAASRGGRLDKVTWAPPSVPTVAYWGESEIFHSLNLEQAEAQPIEWFTIPGGHADAFFPCEQAVSGVTAFLGSQA